MRHFFIFIPGKAIFPGPRGKNRGNCLRVGPRRIVFAGFAI